MKKHGASQERLNNLDEGSIVEYLRRHPDFFVRHAQQVEALQVVHPVRGAVSLVEWHLARQRNHIHLLEESISNLVSQANVNEALFCRLLQLQGRLATASGLQDMLNRFQRWAREMGLSGVSIRLFADRWRIGAPSDFTHLALPRHTFEPLRIQRFGDARHYLGTLNGPELLLLLPQAKAVGSVAMSLLGDAGERGVVIFTSRDAQHYTTGQGTRFLEELARMLPALLEHWLEPL